MSEKQKGKNNSNYKGGKNVACKICHKLFYVKPSQFDRSKTCSMKCGGIWQSKLIQGKKNPNYKTRTNKICPHCKKTFKVLPHQNVKIFCNQKCRNAFSKKENHPSWNGGGDNWCVDCNKPISTYAKRCEKCSKSMQHNNNWQGGKSFEKYGLEFNDDLRKLIRKRDNFTCQICGINQKQLKRKLHVHHIDKNKKNNNPTNLVSLCINCHMKLHRERG